MAGLTLDAGALVAAGRNDRRFWVLLRRAVDRDASVVVPAPVLAQVWRDPPEPLLARAVRGAVVEPLDDRRARLTGILCGRSGTADVTDAAVVVSASQRDDLVLTTDADDLRPLAEIVGNVSITQLGA